MEMFTSSILSQLYISWRSIMIKPPILGKFRHVWLQTLDFNHLFQFLAQKKIGNKNLHFILKILAIRETWNLTCLMHFGLIILTKNFPKNFCSERKPAIWIFTEDWFNKNLMINYSKNLKNLIIEPVSTKFARNQAYDKFPWKLICQIFEFTTALVTSMNVRCCTDKQDLIYR